jgi:toxin HigB-1
LLLTLNDWGCSVRFIFKHKALELLYTERKDAQTYPSAVVQGFFRVMAIIRNAADERDLRALRSLNYEALKGKRSHQNSLRLNRQWRLIVERQADEAGRILWIIDIEDYHS